MDRKNFGIGGEHPTDRTVPFRFLCMNQIRLNFLELLSHGKRTSQIPGSQSSCLGNMQRVKPNIGRELFRVRNLFLSAGNLMDLRRFRMIPKHGKAFKRSRGSSPERGIFQIVLPKLSRLLGTRKAIFMCHKIYFESRPDTCFHD